MPGSGSDARVRVRVRCQGQGQGRYRLPTAYCLLPADCLSCDGRCDMAVAPAPNLSGGVSVTGDCCEGQIVVYNSASFISPGGPVPCSSSPTCLNVGPGGGVSCPGVGLTPVVSPGPVGSCGGNGVLVAFSSLSPLPATPVPLHACFDIWTPCGCEPIPFSGGPTAGVPPGGGARRKPTGPIAIPNPVASSPGQKAPPPAIASATAGRRADAVGGVFWRPMVCPG